MNIRDEINEFITTKYKSLYEIALTLTHNKEQSVDLLHHVLDDLLQKDDKTLERILNDYNIFIYVYVSIMNQYKSTTSTFYKQFRQNNILLNEDVEDINEYDIEKDEKVNEIRKYVAENCDWYDAKLWEAFYFYTDNLTPKQRSKIDNKEYRKLENMSFRHLQDITKINYVSIHITIDKVNNKIKKQYGKDRTEEL